LGDELILNPEYSGLFETILWSGQGEFSCLDCEQPTFVPYFTHELTVMVTDENGCEAQHSIMVIVDEENFIALPNVFSPNDDNINDQFTIHYYGRSVAQVSSFTVFDRWGGIVHRLTNSMIESGGSLWDGYKDLGKVEQGVYVFHLDVQLINGVNLNRTGNITVLK